MQALSQQISGTLYRQGGKLGLFLDETAPAVLLRFALVTQGTGQLIFPALALDDWGRERDTVALYRWVYEEGPRFPRAEVFGFERSGAETQIFLRALETFFKLPCFAYPDEEAPLKAGERLNTVFVDGDVNGEPVVVHKAPATVGWPLRHADVSWQQSTREALARAGWEAAETGVL